MKTKDEIISLFVKKGILSNKTSLIRRPYNWKSKFDEEAKVIFDEFASSYRSEAEAWFCLCRKIELPICPVCGLKKVVFTGLTKYGSPGYNTTCEDCSANQVQAKKDKVHETCKNRTQEERTAITRKRNATNKILHGDENYMKFGSDSFKDNLEQKYGDRNYNNRAQAEKTCLERYNVTCNLAIPEVQQKAVEKSWSVEVRQQRIEKSIEQNGVSCLWCLDEVQERNQKIKRENIRKIENENDCTMISDVIKMYGQGFKRLGLEYLRIGSHVYVQNKDLSIIERYSKEGTHTNKYVSKIEKEILEFVKLKYKGLIIENCTSAVPNENYRFFELDIYLPEIKLGIDVNGIYWHSTKFKDMYYHQRKTKCCKKVGVELLHIFEDEWNENNLECKLLIQDCLNQSYSNILRYEKDVIIGDNSKPIFGNYKIIDISEPNKKVFENFECYDCGTVTYQFI